MDSRQIVAALTSRRFRHSTELELQDGVESVLQGEEIPFERELVLSGAPEDSLLIEAFGTSRRMRKPRQEEARIDFAIPMQIQRGILTELAYIGLELKIAGSRSEVLQQLWRYAGSPQISELILVTTRAQHRRAPTEINGKPLRVAYLSPF